MHGLGDDEGGEVAPSDLAGHEMRGDDAEGRAARGAGGRGEFAHQPDIAGAVDEAEFLRRQGAAEIAGARGIGGVVAGP